jgi:hypothetical protein
MNTDILDALKKLSELQQLGPEGMWKEPAFDKHPKCVCGQISAR